jgi:signal transduction histidine kinase
MSVRRRLLIGLVALVLIVDGLAGLLTYRRALQSTAALLDYQLQQMALSLRDQGSAVPDFSTLKQGQSEFAIQIWNKDGAPIYASKPEVPLAHEGLDGYADLSINRDAWRAFALQTPRRIIVVAQARRVREQWARSVALRAIGPLLLLMPLLAIAVWAIVVRTLEPIKRVADEVGQRDVNSLAPLPSQDLPEEIAPLVLQVNRLLDRLSAAFKVQRSFIADAAHELRSPLTALSVHLQLFMGARTESQRTESLNKLRAAMQRANSVVQQLLTLARNEPGGASAAFVDLALDRVVREAASECVTLARARETTLSVEADEGLQVNGDAESLRILARNLIDNAIRYTPAGGKVLARVIRDGSVARVEVDDSGPGLTENERERVFDRFYRGQGSSESGSGLGLAIVRTIASRHAGQVVLGKSPMGGVRATVTLPIASP